MKKLTAALVSSAMLVALAGTAQAHLEIYNIVLSGPAEAPPNNSPATGTATITVDLDLATIRIQASFSGLTGNTTASHIHANPNMTPFTGTAGVATQTPSFIGFPLGVRAGTFDNTYDLTVSSSYNAAFITANGGTVSGAFNALVLSLQTGRAYLNIHTAAFPGGEIRGFIPTPTAAAALGLGGLLAARRRRA